MRWICVLIGMLALPLIAHGESLPDGGVSAPDVAAALKSAGYPADVTADHAGEPAIRSSTGKTLFFVRFYQCGPALRCGSLQFAAPLRHNLVAPSTIGTWNRQGRFGRAFQDSHGIAWLAMDVETSRGMTTDALAANVREWITVLTGFETFIAR
jgi:Putative bacterial sensory transduction regulator